MKTFNGLSLINLELTSKCNKISCWMCGRRKVDSNYPEIKMNYGDMDFKLLQKIAKQIPNNITIQFHKDGDPLVYPYLGQSLSLFPNNIKCLNTNGKLIVEKFYELSNLDTITISTFENDSEWESQYQNILTFLELQKITNNIKPRLIIRVLGNIGEHRLKLYEKTGCLIVKRMLHSPMGSFNYKKEPVIPETGICLEVLHKLVINKDGEVFPCVRFDPYKKNKIGNLKKQKLIDIWNGKKRKEIVTSHINGNRNITELCAKCEFWGCPKG